MGVDDRGANHDVLELSPMDEDDDVDSSITSGGDAGQWIEDVPHGK